MTERRFRLVTFGCKVNQYDAQRVREALLAAGYRESGVGEAAELCVVNTCAVTARAESSARQCICRLARANPGARIVLLGCYAVRSPEPLARLPGVAAVLRSAAEVDELLAGLGLPRCPAGISRFDGHQRAFLKVQDGCMLDCSYCVIPQVRPPLRSRPPDEVRAEMARLLEAGYEEIVLTGVHLGHYGLELVEGKVRRRWGTLTTLLRSLLELPGRWRIRLSSLEVTEVTDELLDLLAGSGRICPHLHMSLQSGSDRILKLMRRRRYRVATFFRRVERIASRLNWPALTTDIIVGFPGEQDRDFEQTLEVCRQVGFSRIHIFPFSPRPGTSAAEMPDRVPAAVLKQRRKQLEELASELADRYHCTLVGRQLEVVIERLEPAGWARGTACRYVQVRTRADESMLGKLVPVRIRSVDDGCLVGEPATVAAACDRTG